MIATPPDNKNHRAKTQAIQGRFRAIPLWQRLIVHLYFGLTWVVPDWFVLFFVRRAARRGGEEALDRALERVARALPARPKGRLVWLNSIGPGDSTANQALIDALFAQDPDLTILVTTRTVSAQGIFSRWKDDPKVITQLPPHDSRSAVLRFIDHWQPAAVAFCERDIWPNMLHQLTKRSIPIAIVNGQLDGRLIMDFQGANAIGRWMLAHIDLIHVFSERCAALAKEWLPPHVPVLLGNNMKLDCQPLASKPELHENLEAIWQDKPIFTAASVQNREVPVLLSAFTKAKETIPELRMIIAPRWKNQSDEITRLVAKAGYPTPRRSVEGLPKTEDPILIADTYRELGTWFDLSFAAFIGDTYFNGSGHNAYEPVLKGVPVLAGGIGRLFKPDFEALIAAKVCILTKDSEALADELIALYHAPRTKQIGQFLETRGGTKDVAKALTDLTDHM